VSSTETPAPAREANAPASATSTVRLGIEGMHCASCVARIEQELARTPGVVQAAVNLMTEEAAISYLPQTIDVPGMADAVRRAGYTPRSAPGAGEDVVERQERDREREYRTLMHKFWFAAAISLPVVVLSYPDLFGLDRFTFFVIHEGAGGVKGAVGRFCVGVRGAVGVGGCHGGLVRCLRGFRGCAPGLDRRIAGRGLAGQAP